MKIFFVIIVIMIILTIAHSDAYRLTTDLAFESTPCWSPDGAKIAYESDRDTGYFQIWVMNADGTGQHNISLSTSNDEFPSFSPDGSQIAFCSDRTGDYDIYVMPANGGIATRITSSIDKETEPSWSPDGLYIIYVDQPDGSTSTNIWKVPSTGGVGNPITTGFAYDHRPVWSPDGNKIAFASDHRFDDNSDICTMTPDGQNITEIYVWGHSPCWSPKSNYIAFADRAGWEIVVIPAVGGFLQSITDFTDGMVAWPSWSSDFSKIVFSRTLNSNVDIWITDVHFQQLENTTLGHIKAGYNK